MSLNSSSSSSLNLPSDRCFFSRMSVSILTALFISHALLLPLFILVLHVGYQRWRKRRSVATAATMSHSDIITFHMVVLEIFAVLGSFLSACGVHTNQLGVLRAGMFMLFIISPGQNLFHLLTCVERYLAVVHPVTYLGLRQAGGVRIRNISVGCVWLISFGSVGLLYLIGEFILIYTFVLLVFSAVVVSFCSLSVLCVLIRPGPGEVGGNRERGDQSKQRAFYTIMAILGVLLLRFLSSLISAAIYFSSALNDSDVCKWDLIVIWFSLPSSLVLPLLFLHRAGKLPRCKHNTESAE